MSYVPASFLRRKKMCGFLYSKADVRWDIDCAGICSLCIFNDIDEDLCDDIDFEEIETQG